MKELKKLKINIFGKSYTISTDEDEEGLLRAAQLVDSLMNGIAGKTELKDESKIAVLVALQLASDLTKSRKELGLWQTTTKELDALLASEVK